MKQNNDDKIQVTIKEKDVIMKRKFTVPITCEQCQTDFIPTSSHQEVMELCANCYAEEQAEELRLKRKGK